MFLLCFQNLTIRFAQAYAAIGMIGMIIPVARCKHPKEEGHWDERWDDHLKPKGMEVGCPIGMRLWMNQLGQMRLCILQCSYEGGEAPPTIT